MAGGDSHVILATPKVLWGQQMQSMRWMQTALNPAI
jgi:hypothetical protein